DRDLVFAQVGDAGLAAQEPQQLVDDRAQVQLLGGDQREAVVQVEAHLPAEHAPRAGAGPVGLFSAVLQHVAEEIEVLPHASGSVGSWRLAGRGRSYRSWAAGGVAGRRVAGRRVGERRASHSQYRPTRTSGMLSTCP